MTSKKTYPDISDILERKRIGRRRRAAISFSDKLDALDALRDRLRPFNELRAARKRIP